MIAEGTVDLMISQAVLEYPQDLERTYAAMHRWLAPRGVMSHVIDFRSHGMTTAWNGQWACADALWWLAEGRRRNTLNRAPHSAHVDLLRQFGFHLITDQRTTMPSAVERDDLRPRFRHLTDDDLRTSIALMQSQKMD